MAVGEHFTWTKGFTRKRCMRSQASKVLGTTMDRRRTAWLDQAQWRPGQQENKAQIPHRLAQIWWERSYVCCCLSLTHPHWVDEVFLQREGEKKWQRFNLEADVIAVFVPGLLGRTRSKFKFSSKGKWNGRAIVTVADRATGRKSHS